MQKTSQPARSSHIVHLHGRAFVFVLPIWMDCLMLIEFCFVCEDIPPLFFYRDPRKCFRTYGSRE